MTATVGELAGLDRLPMDIRDKSVRDLLDLSGRRAIVTAAGGTGIGGATVHRLAALGASVIVSHPVAEGAERVAREASDRWGTECTAVVTDVTTWVGAHQLVDEAVDRFGGIDILVNNLGGGVAERDFADYSERDITNSIERSLLSTLYCSHAALAVMLPAGSGRIINVSTGAAITNGARRSVYAAAKAGVHSFTRSLANEVGRKGIQVNCVGPGITVGNPRITQMLEGARSMVAAEHTIGDALLDMCMPRVGMAEEVANVIAFLASDAASYVQGAIWMSDGGVSA